MVYLKNDVLLVVDVFERFKSVNIILILILVTHAQLPDQLD